MIIGLSGTHGTGKSTILNGLKGSVIVNEAQIARGAQKALGWDTLSRAEESVENMWLLQEAVLAAMYDRDIEVLKSNIPTIVERTPADVWAYTQMWLNRLGIDKLNDKQAINYKSRCIMMATKYSQFILVPQNELIPFIAEPNRADLKSRNFVDEAIYAFLWDGMYPFHKIKTTIAEDRIAEANAVIKNLST